MNINLTDYFAVFFYFCFLRRIGQEFFFWWYYLVEQRCVRRFTSHLKTWYFRKFSSRIWRLPGANFMNEKFRKRRRFKASKMYFRKQIEKLYLWMEGKAAKSVIRRKSHGSVPTCTVSKCLIQYKRLRLFTQMFHELNSNIFAPFFDVK